MKFYYNFKKLGFWGCGVLGFWGPGSRVFVFRAVGVMVGYASVSGLYTVFNMVLNVA